MQLIGAFLFFIAVVFIGILPFPLMYGFSYINKFFVFRIFGYRKKIVTQNLNGCFPEMTKDEVKKIVSEFYLNLSDIFLESIKAFTMTRNQVINRHRIVNPEILDQFYATNQSFIAVTGHYCNWEWGSMSASLQSHYNTVAFYKPLNNVYIDRFVRWSRSRFGTTLASIKETSLTFEKYSKTPTIFLMASDQGMPKRYKDRAIWIKFLNRDTAFLHGLEKHSTNNNLPVVYVDVQRVKRGYYTVELTVLTNNPKELGEGVITELYARKLESVILKKPENWLWSHRRWKLSR